MNQRMRASELNAQIYEEACAWFIDMRAGDVDAAGRQRFDAWARKSPEHLRAYLEVSEIWDDAPLVDPERKLSPENLIARARASAEVIPLAGVSPNRTTAWVSRAKRGGTEPFMGAAVLPLPPVSRSSVASSPPQAFSFTVPRPMRQVSANNAPSRSLMGAASR